MCSVAFAQHDSLWVRTMYGTGSGIDEVQTLAEDVILTVIMNGSSESKT